MANIRGIELASEIYDLEDTSARNTATAASQTATQAGQTATQASQTATQASQTATEASQKADEMYKAFPSNASDSNKLVTQSDALIYYQSDSSSISDFNNAIPQTNKGAIQMFYLGSDITNAPASSGGGFIVVAEQLSTTYISQLATQIGTNNKYTRSKSTGGWSAWKKLVTENDLNNATFIKQIATTGTTSFDFTSNEVENSTEMLADIMIEAVASANQDAFYKGVIRISRFQSADAIVKLFPVVADGFTVTASVTNNIITLSVSSSQMIYNTASIELHFYKKIGSLSLT